MKDSGESQSPRRLWGAALVVFAASSIYLGDPLTAGWPAAARAGWLGAICLLLLLAHALLGPAALSYALMLDLRRRGRTWLDADNPRHSRLLRLHERTRWMDLSLPLLLTWLLFSSAWLWLDLTVGRGAAEERLRAVAAVAIIFLLSPAVTIALPSWLLRRFEDRLEALAGGLGRGAATVLGPLLVPLAFVGERWMRHAEDEVADESLPEEDLADVIEVGSQQGELSIAQSELLRRELDFARKTAADVMVPRVQVEYLDINMTVAEAKAVVTASRFSRFPVQEGSVDHVVAVLHAKQLLRYAAGDAPETVRKLLLLLPAAAPVHVRADQTLEDVLEVLRRRRSSLAVVDDLYGGVAGILTVEDVVEEIVGEIVDESDAEAVHDSFECSGRRRLAELAEHGLELPGDPESTLAEYLAAQFEDEVHVGQAWVHGESRLVVDAIDAEGEIEIVRVELHLARQTEEAG